MSKGDQTRKDIVQRAFALSRQVGLEGLSLGVLAEDLALSKSGLFAHFKSKEALQLTVLQYAIETFAHTVVAPALREPRGETRVDVLFERYIQWIYGDDSGGRCFFMALAQEYDDRPGQVHDLLVQSQREWYQTIARVAQGGIRAGDFRADLDTDQFAFEFVGIAMTFQHVHKLLADDHAEQKARAAFTNLLERSRIRK